MFNFGERLKSLRQSRSITQKQLAAAIGSSERGIQHYELNERKPTYDKIIAIADYFDVSTDYLLGRKDYYQASDSSSKDKAHTETFKPGTLESEEGFGKR